MSDDDQSVALPRETSALFGQTQAEQALLDAYKSGRIPHAWLIGGPPGIGKATLAYRLARFALVHPDPKAPAVQHATSLAVDPDHPVSRRIAAQAQSDLLVLERTVNEQTGKLYTVIRVDDVRRTVSFFGSTPGEGGWRIAIVDAVDDLQREGANALLKVLEEPPPDTTFILTAADPESLLPTIKSRVLPIRVRPLPVELVERLVLSMTQPGDVVFDPFMGVGSSVIAAIKHHRFGMGCDIDPAYVEIAWERIHALRRGDLRTRPMGKPVYDPSKPRGGHS